MSLQASMYICDIKPAPCFNQIRFVQLSQILLASGNCSNEFRDALWRRILQRITFQSDRSLFHFFFLLHIWIIMHHASALAAFHWILWASRTCVLLKMECVNFSCIPFAFPKSSYLCYLSVLFPVWLLLSGTVRTC